MKKHKSYVVTLLFATFLGYLGIHRFYTRHFLLGFIQAMTFGCCGIWTLIDLILLSLNKFKTADNEELADYNPTLAKTLLVVIVANILLWIFMYMTMFAEMLKGI